MERRSVLILYAEVMGYTMAGIQSLVNNYPVHVSIIGWDKQKLTPYELKVPAHVSYQKRSAFSNDKELLSFAVDQNPEVVFVSGWMDKGYMKVARYFKKINVPVVAFVDNHWKGTLRQNIGKLIAPWMLKKSFSKLWVSGPQQYVFATKMGYRKEDILLGCYTADTDYFHEVCRDRDVYIENHGYPHNITYVGRFAEIKNIESLVNVFKNHAPKWTGWTLTLIGNGPLKQHIINITKDHPQIIIKDFIQPDGLSNEMIRTGIFCLPSKDEPWGVVIHEFASAGIPLVISNVCGAGTTFVEDGVNGYFFNPFDEADLESKLDKAIQSSDHALKWMGRRSYDLSHKITPRKWADTAIQILSKKEEANLSPNYNVT